MPFVCVRCNKEIEKGEVRFIDHDHICVSCLKPKKKKKNKGYIPDMGRNKDYFSRNRGQRKDCEYGCGAQVRSQEAHNSTRHFCKFCSKVFRKIEDHMTTKHHCEICEEDVEDLKAHQQIKDIHDKEEIEN